MKFLFFVIFVILLWAGYEIFKPIPANKPPTTKKNSPFTETDKKTSPPEKGKITLPTEPQVADKKK